MLSPISIIIILSNLIISNLGYAFIVKYLYVVSGIFSGVYVIALIIMIIINLIKYKNSNKNDKLKIKSFKHNNYFNK